MLTSTCAFISDLTFPSLRSLHLASNSALVFAAFTRPFFLCSQIEQIREKVIQVRGNSNDLSISKSSVRIFFIVIVIVYS